jgi:hypothetical protein
MTSRRGVTALGRNQHRRPLVNAFGDAGFRNVYLTPLPEIERIERTSAVDTTTEIRSPANARHAPLPSS